MHTQSSPRASHPPPLLLLFFLNDPATPEISPLPLPDALPISDRAERERHDLLYEAAGGQNYLGTAAADIHDGRQLVGQIVMTGHAPEREPRFLLRGSTEVDRKSTRLNSSHLVISCAVFCLKKK